MGFREELNALLDKYTQHYVYPHDAVSGSLVVLKDGRRIPKSRQEWWEIVAMYCDLRRGLYVNEVEALYILPPDKSDLVLIFDMQNPVEMLLFDVDVSDPDNPVLAEKVNDAYKKAQEAANKKAMDANIPIFMPQGTKEYKH